jgi:hypothetical protein
MTSDTKIKYPFLFLVILLSNACGSKPGVSDKGNGVKDYPQIKKIQGLKGTWQSRSADGSSTETWEMKNDSTFFGTGVFMIGKDTVSRESLSLEERVNGFFYVPTVNEQNKGNAITFALTSSSENEWVFENPQHDFPQKIRYTKINEDSIVAEISGQMNGKASSVLFPMWRAK